jgi:hypothetical protein
MRLLQQFSENVRGAAGLGLAVLAPAGEVHARVELIYVGLGKA